MKAAAEILATAAGLVDGDRKATHGEAAVTFGAAAILWRGHLAAAYGVEVPLTAADVADMMGDLKRARRICGGAHADHGLDRCGYVGLAEALAAEDRPSAEEGQSAVGSRQSEDGARRRDDADRRWMGVMRAGGVVRPLSETEIAERLAAFGVGPAGAASSDRPLPTADCRLPTGEA